MKLLMSTITDSIKQIKKAFFMSISVNDYQIILKKKEKGIKMFGGYFSNDFASIKPFSIIFLDSILL